MGYVYILATTGRSVLYVGVTNDLRRRMYEHRNELHDGFTRKYHVHHLVYFETYEHVTDAICREKQIKGYRRQKKERLIDESNPEWNDLSAEWY